tara:strand:- start:15229 stop:15330 length:102 start_codon:yes stop_codon:yes gene_type:complete
MTTDMERPVTKPPPAFGNYIPQILPSARGGNLA